MADTPTLPYDAIVGGAVGFATTVIAFLSLIIAYHTYRDARKRRARRDDVEMQDGPAVGDSSESTLALLVNASPPEVTPPPPAANPSSRLANPYSLPSAAGLGSSSADAASNE
ncbi:hypothetical protein VFPFJ_03297 [Purpureocillium lilacinum]|uniref:Uncharacterized protein n=1 Tax=Purpureocillium lilacinum TaxID=33203 RepID=A0A179HML8_PURLI|nr:hypothetical protein VFPFJ_03297 [Purpureocillium lilacinum]OAQ91557.1 hypothetical protein VFPFJ_03297 [Purpureocillium lilacinum]PWI67540.1 hypothetical protein PCL_02894 [Purpureocillium lilacinum]